MAVAAAAASEALTPSGLVLCGPAEHHRERQGARYESLTAPHPSPVRELRYPQHTLLVIGGAPGVGKSTLMDRVLPAGTVTLCPDDIRLVMQAQLAGVRDGITADGYHPELWPEVFERMFSDADAALREFRPVVIHATALQRFQQKEFSAVARAAGAEAHIAFLDGNRALCDAGQAARDRQVPAAPMDNYLSAWDTLKFRLLGESRDPEADEDFRGSYRASVRERRGITHFNDRYGAGMDMMAARGYRSVVVLDRAAVNTLQRIRFA